MIFNPIAKGINPKMVVMAVNNTGLTLALPAFTMASNEIKNTHKEYLITAGMLLRPYYDHVFYVSPEGVEIEDNGIRITDSEYRNKIDNNIKRLLENYKPNKLTTIQGSMEERIAQVLDAVGNTDLPF